MSKALIYCADVSRKTGQTLGLQISLIYSFTINRSTIGKKWKVGQLDGLAKKAASQLLVRWHHWLPLPIVLLPFRSIYNQISSAHRYPINAPASEQEEVGGRGGGGGGGHREGLVAQHYRRIRDS